MAYRILFFLFLLLAICYMLQAAPLSEALTMSNASYIIQMSNLNTAAGKPSNSQYNLGVTAGQIAPGLYSGPNYKVKSGFQYIYPLISFTFKISPLTIDFGSLSSGQFVTRNQSITVSNGSAYGYSVTVAENHSLLVPSTGSMIPNTSCNSGTCTTTTAGLWDNTLVYGFGIRCEYSVGSTCASDFNGADFYRPIANLAVGDNPEIIASSTSIKRSQTENLTYKINVASTQEAGQYSNQVIFVATPNF